MLRRIWMIYTVMFVGLSFLQSGHGGFLKLFQVKCGDYTEPALQFLRSL